MQPIQQLTDQVFSGIDISPEDKGAFMDAYCVSVYKLLIELLTAIKGTDVAFHKKFNEFVSSTTANFSSEEKTDFEAIMQESQQKLLQDLLTLVKQDLPAEEQEKLAKNMKKIGI